MNGDFASITAANPCAIASSRASVASMGEEDGSRATTVASRRALSASVRQRAPSPRQAIARSASSGSNQRPRRCRTMRIPASSPSSVTYTSSVCASSRMRESSGISVPARPTGWPSPHHCSSTKAIASDEAVGKPRCAAIAAPRSQRAWMISRVMFGVRAMSRKCCRRANTDPPTRQFCAVRIARRHRSCQSTSRILRLTCWSSLPKSAAKRAALLEQPASLSKAA